jgi:glucosamine 6-phosphate synthetase-like amidotransferase/phosphosugar isomerase protein
MCGVFGFVSYDGKGPALGTLQKVAAVTMRRGPHAFGLSWIDRKGRLHMFKKSGRIVDHLGLLAMASDARMLVGHCRYATHGSPADNLNNHPHPADGGWIVHNGVIANHEELAAEHDLYPVSECDSEVLGLLIGRGNGSLADRCVGAVQEALGSPLVMLGLWKPGRLVAVRAGNPLSVAKVRGGERYYLGSLPDRLPGEVEEVENFGGLEFGPKGPRAIRRGVSRG